MKRTIRAFIVILTASCGKHGEPSASGSASGSAAPSTTARRGAATPAELLARWSAIRRKPDPATIDTLFPSEGDLEASIACPEGGVGIADWASELREQAARLRKELGDGEPITDRALPDPPHPRSFAAGGVLPDSSPFPRCTAKVPIESWSLSPRTQDAFPEALLFVRLGDRGWFVQGYNLSPGG